MSACGVGPPSCSALTSRHERSLHADAEGVTLRLCFRDHPVRRRVLLVRAGGDRPADGPRRRLFSRRHVPARTGLARRRRHPQATSGPPSRPTQAAGHRPIQVRSAYAGPPLHAHTVLDRAASTFIRQRTKVLGPDGGLLACIRTNGRLVTKEASASFNFIPQINVPDLRRIPWG